ncbi:MAG: hypothetical protein Q4C82_09670 [Eubacteriales bacterium]|nr:hypothetical protein [Eubacteriales bacterium]
MDIKRAIEEQRERLDSMAERTRDLTELLCEAEKMDGLIEAYEKKNMA